MKKIFVVVLLMFFAPAHTFAQSNLQFSDIARTADGKINYMTQFEATDYCTNHGQHLPSAREFAQLSTSMGAAGVSETYKDGYEQVRAVNSDGKTDIFYFNSLGYKRPAGDLGSAWFWSSSVALGNTEYAYGLRAT